MAHCAASGDACSTQNTDPTQRQSARSAIAADIALLCLILLAYYAYPLLAPGLEYRGGDPTLLAYPQRFLFVESIRQGILPLWNPHAGCGMPALAEYQGAFLYPLNWLLAALGSVRFGSRAILFLHFLLQAGGMYGLARFGFRLGRGASIFAALALGVSAFNAAHVEHFLVVPPACWAPAVLWAWLVFLREPSPRRLLASAACLAMAIYSGHAQYWVYTLDAMGLLAILPPFATGASNWRGATAWRLKALAWLVLLGAAAFLLSAAQLLPTLELAGHSERALDTGSYGAASSFPAQYLWHYLFPNRLPRWDEVIDPERNPVEMACFLGRITIILACAALFGLRRSWAIRTLVVWIAVFALLALGSHGPAEGALFRLAERVLPGWKGLRVPARLLYLVGMALVLLAAHALDWIGRFIKQRAQEGTGGAHPRRRFLRSLQAAAVVIVCLVVVIEQFSVSYRFPLRHPTPETRLPPASSLPEFFSTQTGLFRVFRLIDIVSIYRADPMAEAARIATLEPNSGIYSGTDTLEAYVEGLLPLARTEDLWRAYWRNLYTPRPDAALLGLANVRYLAADKPVDESAGWKPIAQLSPCEPGRNPITVFENQFALSRVFWKAEAESRCDLRALDGALATTGVPTSRAETPRPLPAPLASLTKPLPEIRVRRLSPNRLRVDKSAESAGTMILAESAYPGWIARWNGGSALLTPVNAIHMGFDVPSGVKTLEIVFEPFSFRLGMFLTLLALGAFASALWLTSKRAQR